MTTPAAGTLRPGLAGLVHVTRRPREHRVCHGDADAAHRDHACMPLFCRGSAREKHNATEQRRAKRVRDGFANLARVLQVRSPACHVPVPRHAATRHRTTSSLQCVSGDVALRRWVVNLPGVRQEGLGPESQLPHLAA